MTKDEEFKLFVYEAMHSGDLNEQVGNHILDLYEESFFNSPVKSHLEKLKRIKNARPDEYTGPKEVKEYLDKYYDDIVYIANIVEQNPEKLRSFNFKNGLALAAEIVVAYALTIPMTTAFLIPAVILAIIVVIHSLIIAFKNSLYRRSDKAAMSDLLKIKAALKKIMHGGVNTECKSKISRVISEIDNAESETKRQEKDDLLAAAASQGNLGVRANLNF